MIRHNVDPWASVLCREIRVGDVVRIPASDLRSSWPMKPRVTAIVLAFPATRELRHCVTVRDLSTGNIRTISQVWAVSR